MERRICPKCGDKNPTTTYTCQNCNASLSSAAVVEVEENFNPTTTCPSCHATISKETRNCPECGELIAKGSGSKRYSYTTNTPQKENNTALYVLSLLVPLVGLIAGAIMLTIDNPYKKSAGVTAIILGIVSMILTPVLYILFFT